MTVLASSLINWTALWKIVLAALIGGCGVVIVFGIVLLSVKNARAAGSARSRLGHWALAGISSAMCLGAVALGVYTMAEKPSSNPAPKPKAAAPPAQVIPNTG